VASLIILVAMFVLLWALLIRPQRAKQQRQQQMLAQIEPGDEILTVGGIYGIVVEVEEDEDDLVVEIADGIHVRAARRAVAAVVKPEEEADETLRGDEDDDAVEADAEEVEGLVTVPEEEAGVEATQRRLAGND
jgi:preprotein translocase subunit YajC